MTDALNVTRLMHPDHRPDEVYHRRTDGQSAAEMMKERSDLTVPSNGPLEFAVRRGCIGFQIIKLNSAGICLLF